MFKLFCSTKQKEILQEVRVDVGQEPAVSVNMEDAIDTGGMGVTEVCCICFEQFYTIKVMEYGHQMCATYTLSLCCHSKPNPAIPFSPPPSCPFYLRNIGHLIIAKPKSKLQESKEKSRSRRSRKSGGSRHSSRGGSGIRYGVSLTKQIKKMEGSQHSKYFCEFCGKRKSVGIWNYKDSGKVKARGTYTLNTANVVTVWSTLAPQRGN